MKPIHYSTVEQGNELQVLKWFLQVNRNTLSKQKLRHRARLVSVLNVSTRRHSVAGNAPNIAMSTYSAILYALTTWDVGIRKVGDLLVIRVNDVTKAYLQTNPSQPLIIQKPSPEFFQLFQEFIDHIWEAIRQLYGKVEAGRYRNHKFIHWLIQNILQLRQSI